MTDETKNQFLENELIKSLVDEIAKERDDEVLYQLYKNIGWYEVKLRGWLGRDDAAEIWCWCRDYLTGNYHSSGRIGYLFELESDAMIFTLRWS